MTTLFGTCPISMQPFQDPVVVEGHTFERNALESYIESQGGLAPHPITRNPIRVADIQPNYELRNAIQNAASLCVQENSPPADSTPNSHLSATFAQVGDKRAITLTSLSAQGFPTDTVYVLDKSGSMGDLANPNAPVSEQDGLTILDVVTHAIKASFSNLGPHDRAALVVFDSDAKVAHPPIQMTTSGRESITQALDAIQAGGGTNLWMGTFKGLETLRTADATDEFCTRNVQIFTDGLSNHDPPRGIAAAIKMYQEKYPAFMQTTGVHTVGYGYALKSYELCTVAQHGQGLYSYIPESSTAATVLINKAARDASCTHTNVRLESMLESGETQTIHVGALCAGQKRIIPLDSSVVDVSVHCTYGGKPALPFVVTETVECDPHELEAAYARVEMVRCLETILQKACLESFQTEHLNWARSLLVRFVETYRHAEHPYVRDLVADAEDQLYKAVERLDWFQRWGVHYLYSFCEATRNEVCNNFRDKSVQHFATPVFSAIRDQCEKRFCTLPPPVPRTVPTPRRGSCAPRTAPVNMAAYISAASGCFAASSEIKLASGQWISLCNVKKGDRVACADEQTATVLCTVHSSPGTVHTMISISGFALTDTHPIRVSGTWMHPRDCHGSLVPIHSYTSTEPVVNLLLDSHHTVLGRQQNDAPLVCCTLAHGFQGGVVEHDYFGTNKVKNDLENMAGYENGHVVCKGVERTAEGHVRRLLG